jgi:hypothetical protein
VVANEEKEKLNGEIQKFQVLVLFMFFDIFGVLLNFFRLFRLVHLFSSFNIFLG